MTLRKLLLVFGLMGLAPISYAENHLSQLRELVDSKSDALPIFLKKITRETLVETMHAAAKEADPIYIKAVIDCYCLGSGKGCRQRWLKDMISDDGYDLLEAAYKADNGQVLEYLQRQEDFNHPLMYLDSY